MYQRRPKGESSGGLNNQKATVGSLLFFASVLFFARSYSNYFVSDDYEFLGRITFHSAAHYFSHSWGYGNEYRPLVAYSYALDAAISGLSPIGYHITNTILHTGSALFVGATAAECGFPFPFACVASALFLLNPVAHESVLWIAGRPVVLSTFFIGAGLWAFVKAAKLQARSAHLRTLSHVAFIGGLLSYEGASVFPLLAFILWLASTIRSRRTIQHVAAYVIPLLVYITAWNVFFQCKITRFPVQSSILAGGSALAAAVLHAFHGASRMPLAILYLGLLIVLCSCSRGRKITTFCAAWFALAYLPFFIVRGFADRFAYLSSAAVATVLSAGMWAVYDRSRRIGIALSAGLICFYAIGMQNRITIWQRAGIMARGIIQDIKAAKPELPPGAILVLLDVPDMYKHAVLFMTGIERAVRLQYPGNEALSIRRQLPSSDEPAIVFQYVRGRMVEVRQAPSLELTSP